MMPNLLFTVSIKSELTGKEGTKTIKMDPDPDGMLERFYEAVRDCLGQIAGESHGQDEESSFKD